MYGAISPRKPTSIVEIITAILRVSALMLI
jgi:hypothetical protein